MAQNTQHALEIAQDKSSDHNPWKGLLYDRLRDRPLPAIIADGTITPAASLWTGARLWVEAFRQADLAPGTRVVIALPSSPAFIQALVAALWEELTVALVPPNEPLDDALQTTDAAAVIASDRHPHGWSPQGCAGPLTTPKGLRSATHPPTPEARFLLRTSGTIAAAQWVALSDENILSVLASHLPHMNHAEARVLSVLPWSHAFGLVLDLLPALLSDAELIRDDHGGRDPQQLLHLRDVWGATHLSAVPLTIKRLLDHPGGPAFLRELRGGIVGGAPIAAPLADALSDTQLRVGYGQTEASPGITLGAPGQWAPNFLGTPVGCTVDVASNGELHFTGSNACCGFWSAQEGLQRQPVPRTVATGDRVERADEGFYFRGRLDTAFKLSNGRLVHAGHWEAVLKHAYPAAEDALLYTPNGDHVAAALCLPADAEAPAQRDVATHLGGLSERVVALHCMAPAEWKTRPKGDVDRTAMEEALRALSDPTVAHAPPA